MHYHRQCLLGRIEILKIHFYNEHCLEKICCFNPLVMLHLNQSTANKIWNIKFATKKKKTLRFLSSIENVRNHYVTTMKIENQKSEINSTILKTVTLVLTRTKILQFSGTVCYVRRHLNSSYKGIKKICTCIRNVNANFWKCKVWKCLKIKLYAFASTLREKNINYLPYNNFHVGL